MTFIATEVTAGCKFKWFYFGKSSRQLVFRQPSSPPESFVIELRGAGG